MYFSTATVFCFIKLPEQHGMGKISPICLRLGYLLKFNAIRHLVILHCISYDYNSVITQCLLEVYNSLAMQEVIMMERMVYDRL